MATVARLPLPVTRAFLGWPASDVKVSCGPLVGIVEEDFPLLIGRFFVVGAALADGQEPNAGSTAVKNRLGDGSWLFDGQRLDQGLRAGKVEGDFGCFAVAGWPGEAEVAVPAFDADFAVFLVGGQINWRGGRGGLGSAEERGE